MKQTKWVSVLVAVTAMLCGCQSPVVDVVGPPAVGAAACALVSRQPAAAGYVKLVGATLTNLGSGQPPSPEALHAGLAEVPAGALERSVALAVWSGAAGAYAALYDASATPAQRQRLSAVLSSLGAALHGAAVNCAPATVASRSAGGPVAPLTVADVGPLARAVELEFKSGTRVSAKR
jgi:hypothetical protein